MKRDALCQAITELKLMPSELAFLLGVKRQHVCYWMAGRRAVPGPVAAYLRVLPNLNYENRLIEFDRLRDCPKEEESIDA